MTAGYSGKLGVLLLSGAPDGSVRPERPRVT
jgi:hypothetical protein